MKKKNLQIIKVDRDKFEAMHYFPVPYAHDPGDMESLEAANEVRLRNLAIAVDQMRLGIDLMRHRKKTGTPSMRDLAAGLDQTGFSADGIREALEGR